MGKKKGKKGKKRQTDLSDDVSESTAEEGTSGREEASESEFGSSKKGKKRKKGKKDKKGKRVHSTASDLMFSDAAFYNLYYIAHDAAHALEIRGFQWPEAPKKKKGKKK